MEQEGRFTTSLSESTEYHLSADRLEITNAAGVLVFAPVPPDVTPAPTEVV